jgi:hypothetical protein
VDSLTAEDSFQPFQLFDVLSTGAVGVVLMAEAGITWFGYDPFLLVLQPRRLQFECALEGLGLVTMEYLVGVGGVRPLRGVTDQHEQLHARQIPSNPLWSQRMEHIVRA